MNDLDLCLEVLLRSKGLPIGNGLSNGHVTNDVTWPRKVTLVTPVRLEPNISETAGLLEMLF